MRILLITQEPPLLDTEIVSGNAVRTLQIRSALETAGHQVNQAWLATNSSSKTEPGLTFRNHDQLQGILLKQDPDAVLVAYWELLALLPHAMTIPVILDYV